MRASQCSTFMLTLFVILSLSMTASAKTGAPFETSAAAACQAGGDDSVSDATDQAGADNILPITCADFVYLDDGRFKLNGAPYQLKGVNFYVQIGGLVTSRKSDGNGGTEPASWEYFLAPYANYFPDNNGVCYEWPQTVPCCNSAKTCLARLDYLIHDLKLLNPTSVRLLPAALDFDSKGVPYASCIRVSDPYKQYDYDKLTQQERDDHLDCRIDLSTGGGLSRQIEIIQQAIDQLGSKDIRSVLLMSSGHNISTDQNNPAYINILSKTATALKTDPYLLAYDAYNEPPWNLGPEFSQDKYFYQYCAGKGPPENPYCKEAAHYKSKTWFDALTNADPYHLVTIGLGDPDSSLKWFWDPHVIYDHFTSYHVYPTAPWNDPTSGNGIVPIHGKRILDVWLYRGALGASGVKCPFLGSYDGANCLVITGPVPAQGYIVNSKYFAYHYIPSGCPVGYNDGTQCIAGEFEPGRDGPFILNQPAFYVVYKNGCPPGYGFDGANCLLGFAPPGVTGFIYGPPLAFYYTYISDDEHCRPPAEDDGTHCFVAWVPSGYAPFISGRPLYYVASVHSVPKKPMYFGEGGFAVFPNGTDLIESNYLMPPQRHKSWEECVNKADELSGDESDQVGFLVGDTSIDWRGFYPLGRACGFQGWHWYQFGSVHYGGCAEDNIGMYTFWYNKLLGDGNTDPDLLVPRQFAPLFASPGIDFSTDPQLKCTPTPDIYRSLNRGRGPTKYRFHGRIYKPLGTAVGNAFIYAWALEPNLRWTDIGSFSSNWDGTFVVELDTCLAKLGITDYGYSTDYFHTDYTTKYCPTYNGKIQDVYLPDFHIQHLSYEVGDLHPPNKPRRACWEGGKWVVQ